MQDERKTVRKGCRGGTDNVRDFVGDEDPSEEARWGKPGGREGEG